MDLNFRAWKCILIDMVIDSSPSRSIFSRSAIDPKEDHIRFVKSMVRDTRTWAASIIASLESDTLTHASFDANAVKRFNQG